MSHRQQPGSTLTSMPEGPHLPRKDTAVKWSGDTLKTAASQVGALVAIQRNRLGHTQFELEKLTGVDQVMISEIERGKPVSRSVTDARIEKLFETLKLEPKGLQANFVKWWRSQH